MSRGPAEFWSFSSGDRICRQVAAAPMSVRDTHAQDVYNSRADGQYECATGIEHCQCVELYEPRRICQSLENPRGIVLCHCGWRFLLLSPPLSPSPCIYIYAIYLCIGCVGHRCRGGYHIKMLLLHLASRMRAGFELHLLLLLLVTMMVVTGFNWLLCTNTALHLYCTSRCLCPIVTQFAPTLNRRHHYHHHPLVPQAPAIREKSRGGQTCRVGVESRQMLERGRQSRSNWKPLSLSLSHTHTHNRCPPIPLLPSCMLVEYDPSRGTTTLPNIYIRTHLRSSNSRIIVNYLLTYLLLQVVIPWALPHVFLYTLH